MFKRPDSKVEARFAAINILYTGLVFKQQSFLEISDTEPPHRQKVLTEARSFERLDIETGHAFTAR